MHVDNAGAALGLTAHVVADLGMPCHTHAAGTNLDERHRDFERLVGSQRRAASSTPEWSSSRRTVSLVENARTTAIGTGR